MNSNLLRESILDAKKVKEAARKASEKAILEENSKKIEEGIMRLLSEQEEMPEEDLFGDEPEMDLEGDQQASAEVADDIKAPASYVTDEDQGADEELEIEFDLSELLEAFSDDEEELEEENELEESEDSEELEEEVDRNRRENFFNEQEEVKEETKVDYDMEPTDSNGVIGNNVEELNRHEERLAMKKCYEDVLELNEMLDHRLDEMIENKSNLKKEYKQLQEKHKQATIYMKKSEAVISKLQEVNKAMREKSNRDKLMIQFLSDGSKNSLQIKKMMEAYNKGLDYQKLEALNEAISTSLPIMGSEESIEEMEGKTNKSSIRMIKENRTPKKKQNNSQFSNQTKYRFRKLAGITEE